MGSVRHLNDISIQRYQRQGVVGTTRLIATVLKMRGSPIMQLSRQKALAARSRSSCVRASCSLPSGYLEGLKVEGRKVLVAGATGKTGRAVVELLRENGVPVRALVRDKAKADKLFPKPDPGLEIVEGDVFQFSSLPAALDDADTIVVATGASDRFDPLGPFNVDYQGTVNLVALAKQKTSRVKKFVLVTSIGADDFFNILNLFFLVLFWKKRAEEELQRSGLDYTIIRPGGLKSELAPGNKPGSIIMKGAGFYGVPPARTGQEPSGSILRKQVAELCVAALVEPEARFKVVEVIAKQDAPELTFAELFQSVPINWKK